MYLNMRTVPQPPRWLAPFLFWRSEDNYPAPMESKSQGFNEKGPVSDGKRRLFQRRTPIQPIPPTRNERGEIIFSSRVDASFRDGYERYRNAFGRKRKEKLEAQQRTGSSWLTSRWSSRHKPRVSGEEKESERHPKAT